MVMKIEDITSLPDGRESWRLGVFPAYQRWENDNASICASDILMTSNCGVPSNQSIFEYTRETSLFSASANNCISATNKMYTW